MQIAIDGPAGAGKSTIARALAETLGIVYIDTGAMYRALTLAALEAGVPAAEGPALDRLLAETRLELSPGTEGQRVHLNGRDVSEAIRRPAISEAVSSYSALPALRRALTAEQQRMAEATDVIMDGRDIGTVVLPRADLKIFLTASVAERARRRHKEWEAKGHTLDIRQIEADIAERDEKDRTRSHAPLKKAADAIEVDTDGMTISEVCDEILRLLRK